MKIRDWLRNFRRWFTPKGTVVSRRPPEWKHPYFIRLGTSDEDVESEVLLSEWPIFTPEDFGRDPRWIIDAGANIGLRSIWFARLFPKAEILAVEPDEANFELLKKNAAPYPNIHCIRAGLWKSDVFLRIRNPDDDAWAFVIEEVPTGEEKPTDIRAVTIGSLMKQYGMTKLDVLKIDIESSEKEVFENSSDWIDSVDVFFVELHDRIKTGCARAFFNAVAHREYWLSNQKSAHGNFFITCFDPTTVS